MSEIAIIIIVLLLLVVFLGIALTFLFIAYNSFQRIRLNVEKSASNIGVLLKQRFDEIPQLVSVCKQFVTHEKDIFSNLVKIRNNFEETYNKEEPHDDIVYLNELDTSFSNAFQGISALAENYPELKSSEQFLFLQNRISSLEEQIADRREYYNESVSLYNARLMSVPDFLFKILFGYSQKDFLATREEETQIPSVKELI